MMKYFCDRCKKDIGDLKVYEQVSLKIEDLKRYATEEDGIEYHKTLCPECAVDIMNIVDFECTKYELKTSVKNIGG